MTVAIGTEQLRTLISRIERLEEEKAGIADDIKDVYGEAKSLGYDTKILRKVISLRKRSLQAREEEEELLRIYLDAIDGQMGLFEPAEA